MTVTTGSQFYKIKLTPAQLFVAIHRYTNSDRIRPPPSDDIAFDCEGGRFAVANVVSILRRAEVKLAKRANGLGFLQGDVEVDEHSLRSFHVSRQNPLFQKYATKALTSTSHPYYLNFIRVIGLRQRGGGPVKLQLLPPHPLPPNSKPPPLSNDELINSRILCHCKPGCTVVHADGAQAYPAIIRKFFRQLRLRAVSHSNLEFVKSVAPVRLKSGLSSCKSGTQCIDSTWCTLDDSIPKQLQTKMKHAMNPLFEEYTFSWLHRINARSADGFELLGKAFR